MAERFTERALDEEIAEQHAVTSGARPAMGGPHPVVEVHAAFLGRAVDQVPMLMVRHRPAVTFALDQTGGAGPDGPFGHGMWDLAVLAAVARLKIAVPRDAEQPREPLAGALATGEGPTVLRFPKGQAPRGIVAVARRDGLDSLRRSQRRPLDMLLVAVGPLASCALETARRPVRTDLRTDPGRTGQRSLPVHRHCHTAPHRGPGRGTNIATGHECVLPVASGRTATGVSRAIAPSRGRCTWRRRTPLGEDIHARSPLRSSDE